MAVEVHWRQLASLSVSGPASARVEHYIVTLYDSIGSLLYEVQVDPETGVLKDVQGGPFKEAREGRVWEWRHVFIYERLPSPSAPGVRLRNGAIYGIGVKSRNAAGESLELLLDEWSPCASCPPVPLETTTTIPVVEEVHEGGFASVTAGWAYSCGLRVDRSVECWEWMADMFWRPDKGSGHGWSEDASSLTPPGGEFVMVDAGWEYACGVRPGGEVECWGRNPVASVEPPEGELISVSVGIEHACALRLDGKAECWGRIRKGYRGPFARPIEGSFTAIAASTDYLCGLRLGGKVECWGRGYDEGEASPPSEEFKSISAKGGLDMCGVRRDGSVKCWGNYSLPEEQVGWEVTYLRAPGGVFESVELGAAGSYTCGLRPGGEAECWNRHDSVEVDGPPEGEKYIDLAVWRDHACGVRLDHTRSCWNQDAANAVNNDLFIPRDVQYVEYESGMSVFSCGLRIDGTIDCLGARRVLEETGWTEWQRLPYPSGGYTSVSVGSDYACGLRSSGEVECLGSDEFGKSTPPDGVFTQITTARDYACGLRPDGEVECWGGSYLEWLVSKVTPPEERLVDVDAGWGGHEDNSSPGSRVPRVDTTSWGYSCGQRANGGALCWGGEVSITGGLGDTAHEQHPVLFPPESELLDVEAGRFRACGLRPSGEAECWGLFDTPDDKGWVPLRGGSVVLNPGPAPGEGFADVDVGGWHVCGLRSSGEVECWDWTQTQGRDELERPYEYELEGPYETISSGYRHACGLRRDGGVDCWGIRGRIQRLPEGT